MHQNLLQAKIISREPRQGEEASLLMSSKPLLPPLIFQPRFTRTLTAGCMNVQSAHQLSQGNLKFGPQIVVGRFFICLVFENGLRTKDQPLGNLETRMVSLFQDNGVVPDAIRREMYYPAHTLVGVKKSLTPNRSRVYHHIHVLKHVAGPVSCPKSVHMRAI